MSNPILRDPALVRPQLSVGPPGHILVLGLDLGTRTGFTYAWVQPETPFIPPLKVFGLGQLDLSAGDFDSGAIRFYRLRQFLAQFSPDAVFFERVRYTPSAGEALSPTMFMARAATSCEFLGSLMSHVGAWCEEHQVPAHGYPIQELKKRATNRGNANKVDMINAANEFLGGKLLETEKYENSGDDNTADSLWALVVGLEEYGKGLTPRRDPVAGGGGGPPERDAVATRPGGLAKGDPQPQGVEPVPAKHPVANRRYVATARPPVLPGEGGSPR
jgi:Holliday junction resolvasome RuvABC endonuclease subunit